MTDLHSVYTIGVEMEMSSNWTLTVCLSHLGLVVLLLFALRSLPGAAEVVGFVNLQIFIEKMNRRMHHAFKGLKHDIENIVLQKFLYSQQLWSE